MCWCLCMARMWILQKADLGLLERARREADSPRSCRRRNRLTLETSQRWEVPLKSFPAARVWSCASDWSPRSQCRDRGGIDLLFHPETRMQTGERGNPVGSSKKRSSRFLLTPCRGRLVQGTGLTEVGCCAQAQPGVATNPQGMATQL